MNTEFWRKKNPESYTAEFLQIIDSLIVALHETAVKAIPK